MIYSFILFGLLWYGSIFFHSAYLHRYSTHKAFKLSLTGKRIFGILTYILLGSSYMSSVVYANMHQRHHLHTDKLRDPHSPKNQQNPIRFMLLMYLNYNRHFNQIIPPFNSFELNNLYWWERILSSKIIKLLWVVFYFSIYYTSSKSYLLSLILTIITSLQGPIQGFLVNWYGHNGRKAQPHNFLSFDFLLLGEAYHKNHHLNEANANFSGKSTKKDITFWILNKLKITP